MVVLDVLVSFTCCRNLPVQWSQQALAQTYPMPRSCGWFYSQHSVNSLLPVCLYRLLCSKMPFYYLHEQLSLCLAHEALFKMFLIKVIALKIVLYKICCKDL